MSEITDKIDRMHADWERKWGKKPTPPEEPVDRPALTKYIVDHLRSLQHATDWELKEIARMLDYIERRRG